MGRSEIIAGGMLRTNTPIEFHEKYGLYVKREDLSCPFPGPAFSKARGVYAHIASRPEGVIGVLDTVHSQAGWAVARACQVLGKTCVNFYPVYKHEKEEGDPDGEHELRAPQVASKALGAELHALPAGRSCILYHAARKVIQARGGYLMPNALKLVESVIETAKECRGAFKPDIVIIPASSGTIAAGVVRGFGEEPEYIIHLGYSRSHTEIVSYIRELSGYDNPKLQIIDENYKYKDMARAGETPPWPCNPYYDLKAFRYWMNIRKTIYGTDYSGKKVLMWNIG